MKDMTEKQKRFCDYYLTDPELDGGKAYMLAYPAVKKKKTASAAASRLLASVNIKAYIDAELEKQASERIADRNEVLEFFTKTMRGELTEERPMVVSLGMDGGSEIELTTFQTQPKDRLKAADALAKRYRLFEEDNTGGEESALDALVKAMTQVAETNK